MPLDDDKHRVVAEVGAHADDDWDTPAPTLLSALCPVDAASDATAGRRAAVAMHAAGVVMIVVGCYDIRVFFYMVHRCRKKIPLPFFDVAWGRRDFERFLTGRRLSVPCESFTVQISMKKCFRLVILSSATTMKDRSVQVYL